MERETKDVQKQTRKKQKIMERSKENLKIKSKEEIVGGIDPSSHAIMSPNVKRGIIGRILVMVKVWWIRYSMRRYCMLMVKISEEAVRRSKEDVQIMEYRGKMYICYKGMPIVGEEDLGGPWSEVIGRSREVYHDWLSEKELEKRNIGKMNK